MGNWLCRLAAVSTSQGGYVKVRRSPILQLIQQVIPPNRNGEDILPLVGDWRHQPSVFEHHMQSCGYDYRSNTCLPEIRQSAQPSYASHRKLSPHLER